MASSQMKENSTQCLSCRCGEGHKNFWARASENSESQSNSCPNCEIMKSGPLFIPSKGIGWTSWKKRWFVLSRKSLMFYRADPNALPQKGSEAPNPTLGGIELNNSGSVVVKQDKKLLTVLFSDGRDGRAFTLRTETLDELNEWKIALEDALAQAPSASHVLGQNGIFCNDVADIIEASVEQCMDILPTTSLIVGRSVLPALEDSDWSPFLEKALSFIEEYGVKVEGILRQSADVEEVVRRVHEYVQGKNEFSSDEDAHVIGDCIKLVLREMPSSPVPASCCTALVDAYRTDRVCRVDYIRDAIYETFPEPNRRLLQRTLKMMRTVAAHKAENRMSLSALAACMAPLLLRPLLAGECELKNDFQIDGDGSFQLLQAAAAANHAQAIVIILLEEYVKIFDNESSSSESEDEEDIEDDESTDNDILQEVGYYDEKNELKSHLVGDSDRSYSGTSRGNESDVASEDSSDLGTDVGSNVGSDVGSNVGSDVGNYAGSDAPGNNVDNIGGSFMKSVAGGDIGSSLSRDEARKNLSVESIEYTSDDESAVHRLENDKIDLQTKISKEIEGNAVLHASLDMRKNALHEHRLALEKEVVMLQVQLKKERDLRLLLELGLMDVQPDHFFNSACLDSKIRMDLEEIALSVRDINILKQNIADITEQLQQDATLCESCGQPIYRYKQENVDIIPNVQKHDNLFKHDENAISSGDSDSSLVKDLTVTGHANAMKKLACQSGSMPFSVDVDFKKQPQDSLSSKNQQLIFEHQQRLSNQDIKVSTIGNSKFVENSEVTKKSSSNAENIIVDSENLKDEVKCSTILVDIQSFQNLPPKISNQSSTKSSGASSSSEDWHTASKKVEGWDCTQMDAPVTLEDQIAPLRNTSTRRHAPKCEEGASSSMALTKLTNRLNFLKERRVQLANELLNLDPSRTTGPNSPSKTNSGSPAS